MMEAKFFRLIQEKIQIKLKLNYVTKCYVK